MIKRPLSNSSLGIWLVCGINKESDLRVLKIQNDEIKCLHMTDKMKI